MTTEEFNRRNNELTEESYRAIRRKISDFSDDSNNDEIAGFVKGVVALQTLLFQNIEREYSYKDNNLAKAIKNISNINEEE